MNSAIEAPLCSAVAVWPNLFSLRPACSWLRGRWCGRTPASGGFRYREGSGSSEVKALCGYWLDFASGSATATCPHLNVAMVRMDGGGLVKCCFRTSGARCPGRHPVTPTGSNVRSKGLPTCCRLPVGGGVDGGGGALVPKMCHGGLPWRHHGAIVALWMPRATSTCSGSCSGPSRPSQARPKPGPTGRLSRAVHPYAACRRRCLPVESRGDAHRDRQRGSRTVPCS